MVEKKSELKDQYRTKNTGNFPETIEMKMHYEGAKPIKIIFKKKEDLRYGTNPHQTAAVFVPKGYDLTVGNLKEIKTGKGGLSQTNFEDMNNALKIVGYFDKPTVAAMKHVNPCGVAQNKNVYKAFERAWQTDTRAAFGSVVGFNCEVTKEVAEAIMTKKDDETPFYIEGIVAPSFAEGVAGIFNNASGNYTANPSIRVFEVNSFAMGQITRYTNDVKDSRPFEIKRLQDGTMILSDQYLTGIRTAEDLTVVTKRKPTKKEYADAIFGWYVCMCTRSNGVVATKNLATVAIGTGQQERIGAIEQAIQKAEQKMPGMLKGSVLVSDGFIPNADNIEAIVKYGITAIIQPGGSNKDEQIIAECNKAYGGKGIAMVFTKRPGSETSERCFAHF